MDPQTKIEALIQGLLGQSFLTHSFLACGRFGESADRFEAFHGPDASSIFDLASLTKALVTGPLVHEFLLQSSLTSEAKLGEWGVGRDAFALPDKLAESSTASLLGHYSGLPAWWNFWIEHLNEHTQNFGVKQRAARIKEVLARVPQVSPGRDLYSDIGYIALGALLEASSDQPLNQLFAAYKARISFSADRFAYASDINAAPSEFVPSAYCPLRERLLRGEVHDENCASLGGVTGHAGLFGTGPQLVAYLRALYAHPLGQSYLAENQRAWRETAHEGLAGMRRGSGPSSASFARGLSIGHLGFTGTAFWLDMERGAYGIWLSNRVISGRLAPQMQEYRSLIFGCFDEILG